MAGGSQLSVTEHRQSNRYPVNRRFIGEHRRRGDIELHLANVSNYGFMTISATGLSRGERVLIRLPHIGRIEAHLIWTLHERAGFQFERIIRRDDFALMVEALQPDQRQRPDGQGVMEYR